MNKLTMLIGLIVILAVGAYFYQSTRSQTANSQPKIQVNLTPTQNPAEVLPTNVAITVNYTDSGFLPQTATIKKGEAVKWINKTDNNMWIASNPHPTHTDYPGFDQLSSVRRDESYIFTFEKSGSWGYHNHQNPSDRGIIIVQ